GKNRLGFSLMSGWASEPVGRAASNFKTPEQSPLITCSLGKLGSNLLQRSANLVGFSAGGATLDNSKADTCTAGKSLIPSALGKQGNVNGSIDRWNLPQISFFLRNSIEPVPSMKQGRQA